MILLVANSSWNLYHYRQPLILALLAEGYEVETAAPKDDFLPALQQLTGSKHHCLENLNPQGQNQLAELACLREITALYKRLQPQLILHFTIKPNIYGGMAARRLKLPYIAVITGLGYTFLHDSWSNRLVPYLYRLGLGSAKKVVFYNEADQEEFIQRRIVSEANSCIINGSGVDINYFQPSPLPGGSTLRCLYVGRLLKDKGLRELVQAVQNLQAKQLNIQLSLLGSPEVLNPEAISVEELRRSLCPTTTAADNSRSHYPLCSTDSNPAPASEATANKCLPSYPSEDQHARTGTYAPRKRNGYIHTDTANTQTQYPDPPRQYGGGHGGRFGGLEAGVAAGTVASETINNEYIPTHNSYTALPPPKADSNMRPAYPNQQQSHINTPKSPHFEDAPYTDTEDFPPIHFAAPLEDVRPYLASHHLFILPSYREGLSRAGAEALACGRPIVVSDVPGCRELVNTAGSNGLLVSPRSVADLEDALLHCYQLPRAQLTEMGKESRQWAEENFSASAISHAFISIIRESLKS